MTPKMNFYQVISKGDYVEVWGYRKNVKGRKYGRTSGGEVPAGDIEALSAALARVADELAAKFGS